MRNSIIPQECYSERGQNRPWFAVAVLACLLSLGLATGNAFAQDQPAPPADQSGQSMGGHMGGRQMPSVDDQIKHLTKKLNLTADQQTKLKPILEDQRTQMEKIHSDSSLSREDRMSKMQSLRESSDTQIKSLLTDDQQKNFDKMRAEQQNRMKQWHKGGAGAPPAGSSDNQQ
jgi:periplasmic protein CpxP/Spy